MTGPVTTEEVFVRLIGIVAQLTRGLYFFGYDGQVNLSAG